MHPRLENLTRPVGLTLVGFAAVSMFTLVTAQPLTPVSAQADAGAELYQANCSACHQPGGEGIPGAFPPLAGNPAAADADYVDEVIRNGREGQLEVLGQSYDSPMPPVAALDDEQRAAVVAYVVSIAGASDQPAVTPPEDDEPDAAPVVGDIDRGHDLFVGSNRFDNGGAACASCHSAGEVGTLGGSSLGPNLTGTFESLGGEAGLSAWLINPPAPTMTPIFSDHPMTEAEIADVVAFLGDAPQQKAPSNDVDGLLIAGLIGLVILIGGMAIAYRGMRQTYAEKLKSRPTRRSIR